MAEPVIVFGPPACGKTRNAERIRAHFGLLHIVDGASYADCRRPQADTLYLTNSVPNGVSARMVDYFSLPLAVRNEEKQ